MNAGVGMSPCAVRRTPLRAAPSVAVMANALNGVRLTRSVAGLVDEAAI
jgi:hypothetical protein